MYKPAILVISLLLNISFSIMGQGAQKQPIEGDTQREKIERPEVGRSIPEFELNDIHFFTENKASQKDFEGKWLILDFFTQNCLACFASFPKINSLSQEFKGKIKFLLIGDNEKKYGKNVSKIYNRLRDKMGLELSVAYDSALFNKWNVTSVPYIVIIDEHGIVRAINNGQDLNVENLKALIDNNNSSSFRNIKYSIFDPKKPYLIAENGGPDTAFEYRSLLSKWKRPTEFYGPSSITLYNKLYGPGFTALGASWYWLYMIAYFDSYVWFIKDTTYGKYSRMPIFINIDSSKLKVDSKTGLNLFNYSLTVPHDRASTKSIMEIMQRDLKNYFGYEAAVEIRQMPYWKLIATDSAFTKLKTKGAKYFNKDIVGSGIEFGNYPIRFLLSHIFSFHQFELPFFDETGIIGNIDIKFDALMLDFNDIKRELRRHNLDLIKGKKEMKVLVISNPNTNSAL